MGRVVEHLRCHCRLYTERYLQWIADQTRMRAVIAFVDEVLRSRVENPAEIPVPLIQVFDPEGSFLDGNRIVVPTRVPFSLRGPEPNGTAQGGTFPPPGEIDFGTLTRYRLIVPTDGVHIEPSAGDCVLQDVPEAPVPGPIHVAVSQETT